MLNLKLKRRAKDTIALFCNKPELFSEDYVLNVLKHMDKSNPQCRYPNKWDTLFRDIIPVLHKYDSALAYLERYGYLAETYFSKLKFPEHNVALQSTICSVQKSIFNGEYVAKYPGLLCRYLSRWNLASDVYDQVFNDDKYGSARRIYALIK